MHHAHRHIATARVPAFRPTHRQAKNLKQDLELEARLKRTSQPQASDREPITLNGGHLALEIAHESVASAADIATPRLTLTAEYFVYAIRRHRGVAVITLAALLMSAAFAILFFNRPSRALTERDFIVLADLTNTTGDPVFDDTLKQALAVHLGQSPFLNILPDQRVRETCWPVK